MKAAIDSKIAIRPPATFYVRWGKRLLDITLSSSGLIALSPVMAICAVLVKLSSRGPVVYSQERVGRYGRKFKILKFRSMTQEADRKGPGITVRGDPRVTSIGKWLRKTKLDETLQLWNVLKGDMSIVGPRPEIPLYVKNYDDCQGVLNVRPGITDPASIAYRNEEEILATASDPDQHYREVIVPQKIQLNLQYISRISLGSDLGLIFRTVSILFGWCPSTLASRHPAQERDIIP